MGKFWTSDVKAVFRKHPLRCTAKVTAYVAWLGLYMVLTAIVGGILILADKNDEWVNWWIP